MSSRRAFVGKKLPLTIAFALLLLAAFGAGCKGFFVDPTLTSITINPTAPSVQVGQTLTLTAFGVNSNNEGMNLTSGVSWSSSDTTVATVAGTGSAVLTGVAAGTATITASSQAVTNTASATVFIVISAIGISPTSASMNASASQNFLVYANNDPTLTNPGDNLSPTAILTVTDSTGAVAANISCSYTTGPGQTCTSTAATSGTYTVTATYAGSTLTAKATLKIN